MRCVVSCILVVTAACGFARATTITAGQTDTFTDGTPDNWTNGPVAPAVQVISTGGPAGAGDKYLKITSDSHLATFNLTQWSGNYQTNNITDIGVDFLNPNANTLANIEQMRIVLFGPNGSRWTSSVAKTVPTDGVWHHFVFSLRQSDLTQVVLGDSYATTI